MTLTDTEVRIDEEFRALIPPLTEAERALLEESLEQEGCRESLIAWRGLLLDGHNRLEICQRKGIPFDVREIELADRDEAILWIAKNQLGRRNLTPFQRVELALKLEPLIAARSHQGERTDLLQISAKSPALNTRKEMAEVAGVSHDTIAKAKVIVEAASEPVKEKLRTGQSTVNREYKLIMEGQRQTARQEEREARAAEVAHLLPVDEMGVKAGDFREIAKAIPDDSVDLIFTDPPYNREALPLYGDLATVGARILKPGGSLITYIGNYAVQEVCNLMTPQLRFLWSLALFLTGRNSRMTDWGIVVTWKPLLWFVKGVRGDRQTFVNDSVVSAQEKDTHEWQQGIVEAEYYIDKLCPADGFVFDPFCGGGTTAVACRRLKRRYLTCDVDSAAVILARKRLQDMATAEVTQ